MAKRIEKVNSLLQEEISKIIFREIDFGETLVTITNVQTNKNLLEGEILITVFPQKDEEKILKILKNNIYDIQKILNKKLEMRPVPKIHFKIDEGVKNLYKIDEISKRNINYDK